MTEEFLYYIWKYRLLADKAFETTDGKLMKLIYPGDRNHNQGPDFTDARLIIDNIVWAGNIEIHVKSSDFIKHKHPGDPRYETIILHVVYEEDLKLPGTLCLELKQFIDPGLFVRYDTFINSKEWLACGNYAATLDPVIVRAWMSRMTIERLEKKSERISGIYQQTKNSWEETLYILLARSYGFSVNADPFEALARKVPYLFIRKHRDRKVQIEALLFGMAGLLDEHFEESYPILLQNEFKAIGRKLEGQPLHKHYWKHHRMRPSNFPDIRIAQLAALLSNEKNMFTTIIESNQMDELIEMFSVLPSQYWNMHYRIGHPSDGQTGQIGISSCEGILINAVIPFLFFYGKEKRQDEHCDKAITWLESLKKENNRLVNRYDFVGLKALNAADTQGLINLEHNYCAKKKCLECMIGRKLIGNS
jgi:hypothetical protein